jgi:hypothetical protein
MARPSSRRFGRRGSTAVEFALVIGPLMLLVFATIEFGLAMRAKATLQYATIQAARCSVVTPSMCGSPEAVAAYASTQMQGVQMAVTSFVFSSEDCGRQVVGTMPFPIVSHSIFPAAFSLSAVACYPL